MRDRRGRRSPARGPGRPCGSGWRDPRKRGARRREVRRSPRGGPCRRRSGRPGRGRSPGCRSGSDGDGRGCQPGRCSGVGSRDSGGLPGAGWGVRASDLSPRGPRDPAGSCPGGRVVGAGLLVALNPPPAEADWREARRAPTSSYWAAQARSCRSPFPRRRDAVSRSRERPGPGLGKNGRAALTQRRGSA